jgi:hypothetical protein
LRKQEKVGGKIKRFLAFCYRFYGKSRLGVIKRVEIVGVGVNWKKSRKKGILEGGREYDIYYN